MRRSRASSVYRVRCRLQNVSKTAAEMRGLVRNSAEVEPFLTCRAFGRIDELACVAAPLALSSFEISSPVHPASFLVSDRLLVVKPELHQTLWSTAAAL